MKSIKAFLKEKGLYLICLALVFAVTITGIMAVRNVVRGVGELTQEKQKKLEEESSWDLPDTTVDNKQEDIPVETPQPSSTPSVSSSAQESSSGASAPSGGSSAVTAPSSASSGGQGTSSARSSTGTLTAPFSGDELVYNETLGDWRTHNGADYLLSSGSVSARCGGTVTGIEKDTLWGGVVEVTDTAGRVWRYCGLNDIAVKEQEGVTAGSTLGKLGEIPAEARMGTHLHLECRKDGACLDPEQQ
ncbi:MAG: M23 family metallopeptidase [Oscillospiraceae bacterium]|nr:M23 family metallopeptidase [Oscillospiraceae bacterium]